MIDRHAPVFVAGHDGLVGSAIVRRLQSDGFSDLLTVPRTEVDLRDQAAVSAWFAQHRPHCVFLAAGTVGGIVANSTRPAEFLYDNMMIHGTVVHAAYEAGVTKLLYLGSSCIYPRHARQPISEDQLLTGRLEPTNESYAIAKIAGIKMCEAYRTQYGCDFISAMPTNLYGPNDNFDETSSHVLPALIRKFYEAKLADERGEEPVVTVWGTGSPMREFLHVDDLADACVYLMDHYSGSAHINVGTGVDVSIRELANKIRDVVCPTARCVYDPSKPDGMPRKVLDTSTLTALGWTPRIDLDAGITSTYDWFLDHVDDARGLD